jgi:succinyl-diaminopimelate desuccinylase
VLDEAGDGLDARGPRELLELPQLVVWIHTLTEHGQDEAALRFPHTGKYDAVPDLAETTLALVNAPSESRAEGPAVELIRELMPAAPVYDDGEVLLYGDGPVVLAGHLDTIPAQGNLPGRIAGGAVHGVGASDMKGGIAVMVELARAGVPGRYLFFTREEVPVSESPLPALFATDHLDGVELAVVLEPTDGILHAGCLGNLQARVDFHGESAHSARPWTGVNAIHELVRGLRGLVALEPHDVELDGLVYREVVSAVRVEGGIASNVVPALASVELNYRFMRDDPAARLRELVPDGELTVLSNSPSAVPALGNEHIRRLRELVPDVAPKQAWTPVAQFAEQGIDAINYGPGLTRYAHRVDEQIPVENLHGAYETLRTFLS